MAIVQMSSFSLLVLKQHEEQIIEALQRFGNVHFKALTPSEDGFLKAMPEVDVTSMEKQRDMIRQYIAEIEYYEKANRWVVNERERKKLIKRDLNFDSMTFEELEKKAREIDIESLLQSMDETEVLHEGEEPSRILYYIEPWEHTKLRNSVLVEIRDATPIVGTVAAEVAEDFAEDIRRTQGIYAMVRKERDGSILFLLKPSLDQRENAEILAQKYHMKRRSAEAVKMKREVLAFQYKMNKMISRRNRTDGSLEKLAIRKQDLMIYYEYLENLLLRAKETQKFLQTDSMILIEGWIPSSSQKDFEEMVGKACNQHHILKIAPAPHDAVDVPVQLKNNRFTSAFESITKMYSTPRYNEVDPTPVFAPFYLLFFGMMLADVGYGLLMAITMFAALKFIKLKPNTEKMARFLFYLSFSTMFWGAIYGSFFGDMIKIPPIINASSEYNRVLIMSIAFGVLHLLVALGVKAYIYIRDGYAIYALFDVGFWYMVILSAITLVGGSFLPVLSPYKTVALWVMIAGMVGILLTHGRGARTLFGKLASGLYGLYGITNYVSDIVSYSRLMALGLAGGSIGVAVNLMVRMLNGLGVVGIIIGALVFIGIHMFNLFISGISAYVHSSRLIYVEFFSKFYTGGGTEFTPFRAKNTYINVV